MKFIMTIKNVGESNGWEEELEASDIRKANGVIQLLLANFNRNLRPGEVPRELVGIRIKENTSEPKERTDRALVVSPADGNGDLTCGYVVVEQLWDGMAGNYWEVISDVFADEADAYRWLDNELLPKSTQPAKKGDPDFLSPHIGGCLYCFRKEPFADMAFDSEFDTNVHRGCIKAALEQDPNDLQARDQAYLLTPEWADFTGVVPEDMPLYPGVLGAYKSTSEPAEVDTTVKNKLKQWMANEPGSLTDEIVALRKETIVDLLDKELVRAKETPVNYVLGLERAKKVLVDYIDKLTKGAKPDDTE